MSKKATMPDPHAQEPAAVAALPDEAIDYADLPRPPFAGPDRDRFFKPIEERVTIRLDAGVPA